MLKRAKVLEFGITVMRRIQNSSDKLLHEEKSCLERLASEMATDYFELMLISASTFD